MSPGPDVKGRSMPRHSRPPCAPATQAARTAICPDVTSPRFVPGSVRRPATSKERPSQPALTSEDADPPVWPAHGFGPSLRSLWRKVGTGVDRLHAVFGGALEDGAHTSRRLLTFCLTDLEGSTRLWDVVPGDARGIFERHEEIIAAAVSRYGGMVVSGRGEGDSTFSVFECPTDAVRAAAPIVRALEAEPWPTSEEIRARIGI